MLGPYSLFRKSELCLVLLDEDHKAISCENPFLQMAEVGVVEQNET